MVTQYWCHSAAVVPGWLGLLAGVVVLHLLASPPVAKANIEPVVL